MRKMIKRFIAGMLLMAIAIGNAGCARESDNENRIRVTAQTIYYGSGKFNTGEYAEEILNKIEDYCDVDLDITWILSERISETTEKYLTSPDTMPMIMTYSGTIDSDVVAAAKNGLYVDLNDYIWDAEKYPNLSGMLKSVADTLTVDGKLIAIPRMREIARYGLCYRTDWAEKLGLSCPETPEDVYIMLYAFTYGDPDGNGIDDTIGLEMCSYTGTLDIIQTWFGCGNGWAEVNGMLIPVHMQEEYIVALDYIKKLYDDGLIAADFAARSTETWSNGCKLGENGVFIDVMDSGRRIWDYFVKEATFTPSVVDSSVPASMTFAGAINGRTLSTSGYNGFFTLSAGSCDTPEKIDAALRLLDRLCDDEMLVLTQYGLEGINYDVEGEYIIRKDTDDLVLSNNYAGLNQLLAYLPSAEHIPTPHVESTERNIALNEAYKKAQSAAVMNPAATYLVNSETYAEIGSVLKESIDTARTQYICGEIDLAELKRVHAEWLKNGGQDIINEVNAAYRSSNRQ